MSITKTIEHSVDVLKMAIASSESRGNFFARHHVSVRHQSNRQFSFNFTVGRIENYVAEGLEETDILGRCTSAPAELGEFDITDSEFADCDEHLSSSRPPLENQTSCWDPRKRRRFQKNADWLMLKRTSSAPAELFASPSHTSGPEGEIEIVTWNIASPNLNPLEYWVTHESKSYSDLMCSVQKAIDDPKEENIELGQIFTRSMFQELKAELSAQKIKNLEELEHIWETQMVRLGLFLSCACDPLKAFNLFFQIKRKAITEFLKDPSFGEKRLISMPDR